MRLAKNPLKTLLVAATLFLSSCSTSNKHSDILFIETGKLIDGVNDAAHADMDIIVINGRIAAIGKDLKTPVNAQTVDLKKYTVLPSLMEDHAPLTAATELAGVCRKIKIKVAHGMKPMEAIKSATSKAAEQMGLEKKIGSLSPGLYADLIAVEGDPLTDINALEQVKIVIKEGRVLQSHETAPQMKTP